MRCLSYLLLLIVPLLFAGPANAQGNDADGAWLSLGRHTVNPGENASATFIERPQTRYAKLRLAVASGELLVYDMRIRYTNNVVEDVDIRKEVRPNRNLIEIDPRGGAAIRQIEVRFRPLPRGQTVAFEILGEDAELKQILASYEVVDTVTVRANQDRVTFDVGRREGRMTDIRFRALDGDFFVRRAEVVFPRGEQQDVRVRDRIEDGSVSDNIDLAGEARFVREVNVDLSRRFSGRRDSGRLQLLAKVDRSRPWGRDARGGGGGGGMPDGWVRLGSETASVRGDRDIVQVGRQAGMFERIALRVSDANVFLNTVTIVYGNGDRDVKRVAQEILANGRSGVLNLRGDRFIDQIELDYRAVGGRRQRASIEIFGEHSDEWRRRQRGDRDEPVRREGAWTMLGSQRATMLSNNDWDVFQVGRAKGRFRAIKLIVRKHDVQILNLRVVYSNNEVEDLPFSGTIDDGRESQPIDLKGRGRTIERIEIRHRTKFNFKGEGSTEVWGLE